MNLYLLSPLHPPILGLYSHREATTEHSRIHGTVYGVVLVPYCVLLILPCS